MILQRAEKIAARLKAGQLFSEFVPLMPRRSLKHNVSSYFESGCNRRTTGFPLNPIPAVGFETNFLGKNFSKNQEIRNFLLDIGQICGNVDFVRYH
jgi:hypothetical protein